MLSQYKDGLSHGKGKLFLRGEGQYEGDFVAGKKHGRGKWMGPDDMVYGEYFEDRRHGMQITPNLKGSDCIVHELRSRGQRYEVRKETLVDNSDD